MEQLKASGNAIAKVTDISSQLSDLHNSVSELENQCGRLQPIIGEHYSDKNSVGQPESVICPLANDIRSIVRRIDACNEMMSRNQL